MSNFSLFQKNLLKICIDFVKYITKYWLLANDLESLSRKHFSQKLWQLLLFNGICGLELTTNFIPENDENMDLQNNH